MRGCIKIYPFNFKDYYQILQVHYDASPDVIKAAYRKLCTLYHPDVSHNPNEDKRMLEINEAYNILSNPDKRTAYHKQWRVYSNYLPYLTPLSIIVPEAAGQDQQTQQLQDH